MAQIQLRDATIRIIDGYTNDALVNDTVMTGDTTIDVDTLDTEELIDEGTRLTIVGNNKPHYITGQNRDEVQQLVVDATSGTYTLGFLGTVASPISEEVTSALDYDSTASEVQTALEGLASLAAGDVLVTLVSTVGNARTYTIRFMGDTWGGVNITALNTADIDLAGGGDSVAITTLNQGGITRQITFTPAILTADGIPSNNAVITFAGRTLEIKIGEGNLTYNEQRTIEYKLDRGSLDTVRQGNDIPMDVSLDFVWEFLTAMDDAELPTIEDAFKKRGRAANWTTSSNDACEPYAVDIEIEHVPPCGSEQREIITLPDFRHESFNHNLRDATVAVSGKCNATEASVVRAD